jgi:hypothetical protein
MELLHTVQPQVRAACACKNDGAHPCAITRTNVPVRRAPAGQSRVEPSAQGGRNCEDARRGGRASLGFVRKLMASYNTVVICNEAVRKAAAGKRLTWASRAVVFPGTLTQRWAGDTRTQWLRRARELAAPGGTLLPRLAAVASGRSLNHLNQVHEAPTPMMVPSMRGRCC